MNINQFISNLMRGFGLLAFLALTGCNKDKTDPPVTEFLRFSINGTIIECNASFKATSFPPGSNPDDYLIMGGKWPGGEIAIELHEGISIAPGNYPFQGDKLRYGTLWLNPTPGTTYDYSAGKDPFASMLVGSGQIAIAEIAKEYVKGTFSFTTGKNTFTGEIKTVTDGSFFLKRDN